MLCRASSLLRPYTNTKADPPHGEDDSDISSPTAVCRKKLFPMAKPPYHYFEVRNYFEPRETTEACHHSRISICVSAFHNKGVFPSYLNEGVHITLSLGNHLE